MIRIGTVVARSRSSHRRDRANPGRRWVRIVRNRLQEHARRHRPAAAWPTRWPPPSRARRRWSPASGFTATLSLRTRMATKCATILREMIALAPRFGTDLVCCFAGRVTGAPSPESIPRFRGVFSELAAGPRTAGSGSPSRTACKAGTGRAGDRNLAHNPAAWELMFEAVPSAALGLEWEPAHQLCQLIDPMPQLRAWAPTDFPRPWQGRGDPSRSPGARRVPGSERFCLHRFPGLGESNWAQIISELVKSGVPRQRRHRGRSRSGLSRTTSR